MPASVLSTAVIIAAALVFVALERRFPYDPRQRLMREGFWMDLVWYTLVQNLVLGRVIARIIVALDQVAAGRLHLMSRWPLAAQALFFLVTHDLYIYWFHRLQHRSPLLWRIHEAHHSTRDVDWLSGARSHFLEILVNQTVEFLPLAILGASPEVWYFKVTIDAVWGMYIHSNIDAKTGLMQVLVNGPEMHRWHHATEIVDVNFATKIAMWDWLFGTAYLPPRKPGAYGLVEASYPMGYFAQAIYAFRRPRLQPTPESGERLPESE